MALEVGDRVRYSRAHQRLQEERFGRVFSPPDFAAVGVVDSIAPPSTLGVRMIRVVWEGHHVPSLHPDDGRLQLADLPNEDPRKPPKRKPEPAKRGSKASKASKAKSVVMGSRWKDGTVHLVSPDPYKPGAWRSTRFDEQGPAGHTEARTFDEAVQVAKEYGADLKTKRSVTPETVDRVVADLGKVGLEPESDETRAYLDAIVSRAGRTTTTAAPAREGGARPLADRLEALRGFAAAAAAPVAGPSALEMPKPSWTGEPPPRVPKKSPPAPEGVLALPGMQGLSGDAQLDMFGKR